MTYSLGATGARADSKPQVTTLKVDDVAGLPGSQAQAMRLGTPVLCQNPDGSQTYYVIDAERSVGSNLVMKPL